MPRRHGTWICIDMNSRRKRSRKWAERQDGDLYVRQARTLGLRARSVFKLSQVDGRYGLIRPDSRIVDLGCAPGSWCEYAASVVRNPRQVIGVDRLETSPIKGVRIIQGDFADLNIQAMIRSHFGDEPIDLVLSDMAPNLTGIHITDQANAKGLQDSVLAFCRTALSGGGKMLTKVFQGESLAEIRAAYASVFSEVIVVKPGASRSRSREVYLLGTGFHGRSGGVSGSDM